MTFQKTDLHYCLDVGNVSSFVFQVSWVGRMSRSSNWPIRSKCVRVRRRPRHVSWSLSRYNCRTHRMSARPMLHVLGNRRWARPASNYVKDMNKSLFLIFFWIPPPSHLILKIFSRQYGNLIVIFRNVNSLQNNTLQGTHPNVKNLIFTEFPIETRAEFFLAPSRTHFANPQAV